MIKKVYLTIDDSPSMHMDKKVDFLVQHKIPAVFFCRGEFIQKHIYKVVKTIQNGFLIGNHSYSHPYFSAISLEQCFEEILKTEDLIEKCYLRANIKRPKKIIRLPFGDRGGDKEQAIQDFLISQGFEPITFDGQTSIDTPWTWDSLDYKNKMMQNPDLYLQNLENYFQQSEREDEIILLHDFDHNHQLFDITMEFLLNKNVEFS